MSAIIRAYGTSFDVDAFLAGSDLQADTIRHTGEPRSRRKPDGPFLAQSVLTLCASEADFDEFPRQLAEAARYLKENRDELSRLVGLPGIEGVTLDFGVEWRDGPIHNDFLPADLIREAGRIGLAIEVSHYWADGPMTLESQVGSTPAADKP